MEALAFTALFFNQKFGEIYLKSEETKFNLVNYYKDVIFISINIISSKQYN